MITTIDFAVATPSIVMIDMNLHIDPNGFYDPHDVAIVPAGDLAVMTFDKGVSLFNLDTRTHVATSIDNIKRLWPHQVDSVEVTDEEAIVLGHAGSQPSIKVFDLRAGSPPVPTLTEKAAFTSQELWIPHDLAIQPAVPSADMREVAVIKGGFANPAAGGKNVVLMDFAQPTVPAPIEIPSDGNPRVTSHVARISDSIVTISFRVGLAVKRYGVAIGAQNLTGNPAVCVVDVFPLDSSGTQDKFPVALTGNHTIPTDLAVSQDKKRVFVRCQAPPDEGIGQYNTGRDVLAVGFDLVPNPPVPFLEVGYAPNQIGGQGIMDNINMADTMIVYRERAVSVSRNTTGTQKGYVHTTENP